MTIEKDGNLRIYAEKNYRTKPRKNVRVEPHIRIDLNYLIREEYKKEAIDLEYNITNPTESLEKLKLLFFLKTGEFQSIKVKLSKNDIRYFEDVSALRKNKEVSTALSEWQFKEILISIDEEKETIIKPK
jgi:hypothetical protein